MTTATDQTDQRLIGETERRVWVGCLACYSDGRLNGEWMSPDDAVDWECDSPSAVIFGLHEETWCFDMEGFPTNREMSPCEALSIHETMLADEEAGHGIPAAVCHVWRSEYGTDEDPADSFIGAYDSLRDYVETMLDDGVFGDAVQTMYAEHPGWVDVDAIVNDIRCEGMTNSYEHDGTLYLFQA